jgi:hypothetical protein
MNGRLMIKSLTCTFLTKVKSPQDLFKTLYGLLFLIHREKQTAAPSQVVDLHPKIGIGIYKSSYTKAFYGFEKKTADDWHLLEALDNIIAVFKPHYLSESYAYYTEDCVCLEAQVDFWHPDTIGFFLTVEKMLLQYPCARERLSIPQYLSSILYDLSTLEDHPMNETRPLRKEYYDYLVSRFGLSLPSIGEGERALWSR